MSVDNSLKTQHKPSYFIHVGIVLLLMLGFGKLPPIAPLTELGMQVVGIFLGMIWGWLFCTLSWPSLIGLVILGFTDYCSISKAFATGFSNNVVMIIIMIMAFLGIIQASGVSEWLGFKIISAKFAKGRPWVLTALIWIATIVMASIMGAVAPLLIMWEIVYTLANIAGYQKGDPWPSFACAGVVVFSCIGCFWFPITEYPILVYGTYQALSGITDPISFVPYVVCTTAFMVCVATLYLLVVKYIFKPDVSKLADIDFDFAEKAGKLNAYQKLIMGTIVVVFLVLILPTLLPAGNALRSGLSNIGLLGVGALGIAIFTLSGLPGVPKLGQIMNHVNWNIVFMMIAAMTMTAVLKAPETGFNDFISQNLTPFTDGKSGYALAAMVTLVALLMTQVCNNNGTSVICITIAYNILGANSSISMMGMVICVMAACDLALVLPSGSAVSAMLFGNDWVSKKVVFQSGLSAMLIGLIVCLAVVIPLSFIMF